MSESSMTPGIARDVPLAGLTTLGLGGAARWFAEPHDEGALQDALAWADACGVESIVIGGGSNLVVADAGVEALVIRYAARGITRDDTRVCAAAGEPWDELVARCVDDGLAGLECLSGIPGSVGATPIQNVGAYGCEVADTISRVRVLDRDDAAISWWTPERCGFGYRTSTFKRTPNRHVVLAVEYQLREGAPTPPRYAELARALADSDAPGLADVRAAVLTLRRSKSMVIDAGDPNHRSVGSFFTNPVVETAHAERIAERARALGLLAPDATPPRWPTPEGRVKLAAAWLIERSGIAKGLRHGAVGVSSRHTLALVHHGGGTTAQLLALAREIHDRVRDRFDVELVPEPVLLGTTW